MILFCAYYVQAAKVMYFSELILKEEDIINKIPKQDSFWEHSLK